MNWTYCIFGKAFFDGRQVYTNEYENNQIFGNGVNPFIMRPFYDHILVVGGKPIELIISKHLPDFVVLLCKIC